MSILIKDMGMPTRCEKCDLAYDDDGYFACPFTKAFYKSKQRPSWCPLIELPSHGDLIDRRKLPLAFVDVTDLPMDRCLPVYLQEDVDNAPIVVESEET